MNVTNSCLLASECDDGSRTPVYNGGTLNTLVTRMSIMQGERVLTENSIFIMSCFTAPESGTTSTDLLTLTLSPVSMAWSTLKLLEDIDKILQSAGIWSPTATEMMSPGTSSEAWIRANWPDLRTLASSGEYSFKAYTNTVEESVHQKTA